MRGVTVPVRLAIALACLSMLLACRSNPATLDAARTRLAQIAGDLTVAGLDSAVEVRRDRWGVPHIYATTQHDLFFAQGLVAAQDRLWQIDMWRRIGDGRLSEVLGPDFFERDKFARLLKYRGDMDAEWTSYAPDTRVIVSAFVAGLNAWAARVRDNPPIEYSLLGFLPEPFADEVPLQRMAALSMTGNATSEISRARLVALLGADKVEALWPPDPFRDLDPATTLDMGSITATALGATNASYGGIRYPQSEGSNNWVISGAMTRSGKPLLANDPHRRLSLPSLRYLSHLVGPGWNVIGAGEPGVPGVAAGHNERVGFGFTIVGMDQQDVYLETLGPCPDLADQRCYRYQDGWRPLRVVLDTIPIKGELPRVVQLEFTEHGPIVGEDSALGRGYVIRFVGSEPGTAGYLAQLSINRASDWASFKAAAYRWRLPTENLVYADVDGNIGWVAAGLMPVRHWSGMLPVPGDDGFEWDGFLPFDKLPQSYNPPSGVIITANNNILPPGYKLPLNYEWASPFRANWLASLLVPREGGWTREDFERLQHDEFSRPAEVLVPRLLAAAATTGRDDAELGLLRQWDFVMRKTGSAPTLFEFWVDSLNAQFFGGQAGADAAAILIAEGYGMPTLVAEANDPGLLLASFDAAVAGLRAQLGADPAGWHWGDHHRAPFPHPVSPAFGLPSASRGGNGTSVNVTSGPGLAQTHGASFREILDFADWDNSVATSVPGQSGQPGSPFYDNLLQMWEEGRYFPLLFSRAAVERETAHVLWLRPGAR